MPSTKWIWRWGSKSYGYRIWQICWMYPMLKTFTSDQRRVSDSGESSPSLRMSASRQARFQTYMNPRLSSFHPPPSAPFLSTYRQPPRHRLFSCLAWVLHSRFPCLFFFLSVIFCRYRIFAVHFKYFGFLFRCITCGQELFLKISFSFVCVLVFLGMARSCARTHSRTELVNMDQLSSYLICRHRNKFYFRRILLLKIGIF